MPLFRRDILVHQIRATLFYWGLLPALVFGSGLVLDRLVVLPRLQQPAMMYPLAIALILLGIVFISLATRDLQTIGGGTPSPFRPAKNLVTTGSYGLCRHPMHFGYDALLLGSTLLLWSPCSLLISLPLFGCWQAQALKREERILSARFGQEYQAYRGKVPFLLPRLSKAHK